jgi:hypothetical protein
MYNWEPRDSVHRPHGRLAPVLSRRPSQPPRPLPPSLPPPLPPFVQDLLFERGLMRPRPRGRLPPVFEEGVGGGGGSRGNHHACQTSAEEGKGGREGGREGGKDPW